MSIVFEHNLVSVASDSNTPYVLGQYCLLVRSLFASPIWSQQRHSVKHFLLFFSQYLQHVEDCWASRARLLHMQIEGAL